MSDKEDHAGEEEDSPDYSTSYSSEEEEIEEKKTLPIRASRGKRSKDYLEDEGDEEFWNQDAWKELDNDDEIRSDEFTSDDFADSSDSDIDLDEEAEKKQEEQEAIEAKEVAEGKRKREEYPDDDSKKKKSKYVDPALVQVKRPKVATERKEKKEVTPIAPRSITVRETTKALTESTKALDRSKKTKKKGTTVKKRSKPKFTHREILESATSTEIANKRALAAMLLIQEEQKKRREAADQAGTDLGPRIIFKSTSAGNRYLYTDPDTFPVQKLAPSLPQKFYCVFTGVPARYRFPSTNEPFGNILAYRQLKDIKSGDVLCDQH